MHSLRADRFLKAFEQLAVFHQTLTLMPPGTMPRISKHTVDEYRENVECLVADLTAMGMTGAVAVITRGMQILNSAQEVQHEGQTPRLAERGPAPPH